VKQLPPLIVELKRALKDSAHTYADVAVELGLSTASVKRLFSSGRFSVGRFEQLCGLAGVGIAELATRAEDRANSTTKLTLAQEREIVSDPKLFLLTWLVLNRAPFEEIVRDYTLTEREVLRYLLRLDRLRVIELLPGNRVKLLVDRHFNWRADGPVQMYLFERLLQEFFASRFAEATDEFYFHGGAVSDSTLAQLRRAIRTAAGECVEIIERDRRGPARRNGAAFVLAVRPWNYSGFSRFRRD
jgi:AcrR family transcriptional regulator